MGRKDKDVECDDDTTAFRLSEIMAGCDGRGSGRSSDGASFKVEGSEKLSAHRAEVEEEKTLAMHVKIAAFVIAVVLMFLIGVLAKVRAQHRCSQ
jgi:hypothetical protein